MCLVLTRKVGEEVVIGNNVRICVVSVEGRRVRLSFDAPRNVEINRAEVELKLHRPAA